MQCDPALLNTWHLASATPKLIGLHSSRLSPFLWERDLNRKYIPQLSPISQGVICSRYKYCFNQADVFSIYCCSVYFRTIVLSFWKQLFAWKERIRQHFKLPILFLPFIFHLCYILWPTFRPCIQWGMLQSSGRSKFGGCLDPSSCLCPFPLSSCCWGWIWGRHSKLVCILPLTNGRRVNHIEKYVALSSDSPLSRNESRRFNPLL